MQDYRRIADLKIHLENFTIHNTLSARVLTSVNGTTILDMSKALNLIDIYPQTEGWSCKVRVIKKNEPKNAIETPGKKYMLLILEDETGTRVQSTVFDHDIGMYDIILQTNKWYIISNASVKPARSNYKVVDHRYNYTWILNGRTSVQTVEKDDTPLAPNEQVYTAFSNFYECMKTTKEISIVAIVIDKLPKQFVSTAKGNQKINDFIVVDENLKPIILTIWGQFVDKEGTQITQELEAGNYPVISADYIAVVHFKGISLSTRAHSTILVQPEVSQAKRGTEHRDTLDAIKRCRDYNNAAINLANPEAEEISTIAKIPTSIDPIQPVWIKGKVSFKQQHKETWYIGCSHCMKKVYAEVSKQFHCMHCGEMTTVGTPRCKMDVEITDGSGCLVASVFGKCAEQLLLLNSKQVMQLDQQGQKLRIQDTNNCLQDEEYIIQLRSQSYTQQGKQIVSYTVTSLHFSFPTTSKQDAMETQPGKKKLNTTKDEDNSEPQKKHTKKN